MKEELTNLINTVKSLAPIVRRAMTSGQLLNPQCEMTEPDPDVLCEYGVEVPVSDGSKLTANIFRSRKADSEGLRLPVIMCAHPYDNRLTADQGNTPFKGPPQQYRIIPQTGRPRFSSLTSWESPDPNFWVAAGYAVVNLNLPGYANSEGKPTVFSADQARGYHDAIEWVAQRPWSTGKVGLNGVSFLAISQYYVAAGTGYGHPPPSLCAISPWEGLSDPYMDVFAPGGVSEVGFPAFWWSTEVKGTINGTVEDFIESEGSIPTEFIPRHPLYDEFWKSKVPDLAAIRLPMLVCASFSDHNLHTQGSFRAFERATSEHKWVYTHRTGKWDAYYSAEVQQLTQRFMDYFVKGDTSNGFIDTPRVRLEVRKSIDEIHDVRAEGEWPLARTTYQKLYLAGDGQLDPAAPSPPDSISIDGKKGEHRFRLTFDTATELTGYMKLRLRVALEDDHSPAIDDLGLFAYVFKLGKAGEVQPFRGSVGSSVDSVTRGYGRVALRKLNPDLSSDPCPVIAADGFQPVGPGEVVTLDLALFASSTWFDAGESIELAVATHEIVPSAPYQKDTSHHRGRCRLHFGGDHDAYLLVPKV